MTGQQHVIDMRLDGYKPVGVFVWVDSRPRGDWSDNPHQYEEFPMVFIEPGERIENLDFRWVIGLPVNIAADSVPRLAEVTHAIRAQKAKRVICALFDQKGIASMTNMETGKQWLRPKT